MLKNLKKSLVVFSAVASMATATEEIMPTIEITTNLLQLPQNVNLGGLFATPYFTVEADIDLSITRWTYDLGDIVGADKVGNYVAVPRAVLGVRHHFNNSCEGFYAKAGIFVGMSNVGKVEDVASKEDYETRYTFSAYAGFGHKFQIINRVSISNSVELSKVWLQTSRTLNQDNVSKYDEIQNGKAPSNWNDLKSSASFRLLNLEIRVL